MPGHMFGKLDFGHFHLRRCRHLQFMFEIVVCFWPMFWDVVGGLVTFILCQQNGGLFVRALKQMLRCSLKG